MEILKEARYRQKKGEVYMTIEKKLREVAKERIRKAIRDEENMEIVLKYDTPDEKIVSSRYLSWYREILNEEWKQYNAGKTSKEGTEKSGQAKKRQKTCQQRSQLGSHVSVAKKRPPEVCMLWEVSSLKFTIFWCSRERNNITYILHTS